MTIDSRPINACTEPMPWPMPMLDAALTVLVGSRVFFTLDWFKGYWQLALHEDSQMYYSFMTPFGVYTPTRVLMGQTDAVAFCQSAVDFTFADLLFKGLLAWLDDMLGYAEITDDLFDLLEQVLTICSKFGLKLNPRKCDFFLARLNGAASLCALAPPITAADLQQFVCATNWMRASIPCYTELVAPLRQLLDQATKKIGSAKKIKLARVQLSTVGWDNSHMACFNRLKDALLAMVPLAHPRADMMVCLYTDASEGFWGAIATQVPYDDLTAAGRPATSTSGVPQWSLYWNKRALANCREGSLRPGFRLFTDHKNLKYIFNPAGQSPNMARYQAHKLERWALVLSSFPYTIECLPGEDNVWGDLLSRWGASTQAPAPTAAVRQLLAVVSPLQQADFDWPTTATINPPPDVTWNEDKNLHLDKEGRIWIPPTATDLQQRICIIGHQGAAGHRRIEATTKAVSDVFTWATLDADVKAFVQTCIHCLSVDGAIVPRPLGSALHAEKPQELIHFDWLSMPTATNGWQKILVIKDDMSGFVRLWPSETSDATATANGFLDWFTTFGYVHIWVSDSGSHFKNEVIDKLRKAAGAHHHFTTAYCPWANGTVEVVNPPFYRLAPGPGPRPWRPLNHMPSDRLNGVAPVTAFTGLPATTPLSAFVNPITKEVTDIDWLDEARLKHMAELHEAMNQLHRDLASTSAKKRRQARERQAKKKAVQLQKFSVGDFVLVGHVTRHANKLTLHWRGPSKIVRVVTDYVMETQELVPPYDLSLHHAYRLKMYCEGGRDVSEDLADHIAFGNEGFHVARLGSVRVENGE
ncbi:hypothetical protein Ae201684_011796 [Aphanomyces euteiches]|uniref:Integrase catalytic domain-containing protein n=1 Tax=Aphanomyces euteiches TaxID=100861 RepID=A0A6G0WTT3_9STRA|nr:hypothetical protein Ae201684_011796 [Aphanomyces euteiches]